MARTLVTPALPYANGDIHLGHMVEHIQVNTYVRALRMAGDEVLCVCGADSHGAPIEIAATEKGQAPEQYVEDIRRRQEQTFVRFGCAFDGGYGSTHTAENERHAGRIFEALQAAGNIVSREVEQLQDPTDGRFLADRFVKGTCPKCGADDQYGDSCEQCGSTYRATELLNPRSRFTGATPVLGKSAHYFVRLEPYADRLRSFLARPGVLHDSLRNFLQRWFDDGLKDWDVSRDGPYFGFKIPGEDNKYFYVWLDAPIGYISLTERALKDKAVHANPFYGGRQLTATTWEEWWRDPSTRIEHFIGKDILYFHTLFWPAMLMATGETLPSAVHVHGMLTVNGVKMSKSRGTFLNADPFADVVDPQALRYFFAAKTTAEPQDIDLNLEDLVNRVNADVVNNIVNLISRTVPLLHKYAAGKPSALATDLSDLVDDVRDADQKAEQLYRALDFAGVVRSVIELGNKANKVLQDQAPWELVKNEPEKARQILSTTLWVGKTCIALLKPVLPMIADKVEQMLGLAPFTFRNAADPLPADVAIRPYERLFERLDGKVVQGLIKPSAEGAVTPTAEKKPEKKAKEKPKEEAPPSEISIDEFLKVDLRAGKVLSASAVEGSDKLIAVKLSLGPLGERDIFAGLRPHVAPEGLIGRTVVVVANLAPRKMKFGMSFGMMLAAGDVPVPLFIDGATPGDRVR